FNPNNLQLVGSSDSGATFSTPVYVNDGPFSGAQRDIQPRLVVSQGTTRVDATTLLPVVSPGQLTVVWVDSGSGRGGSNPVDIIKTDVVQDGVQGFTHSDTTSHPIIDAATVTPPAATPTIFT